MAPATRRRTLEFFSRPSRRARGLRSLLVGGKALVGAVAMEHGWTTPRTHERRRYYRLPLRPPLRARLRWIAGEATEDVRILDVSEGGCAVALPRPLDRAWPATDKSLLRARILIQLPVADTSEPFLVVAEIRNVSGRRLGFEFIQSVEAPLDQVRRRIVEFSVSEQRKQLARRNHRSLVVPWAQGRDPSLA